MTLELHPFDHATELVARGDGAWSGETSDAYWNFIGPFGGVTAATLLRSVLADPRHRGDPVSVSVNFSAPVARGGFAVRTRMLRSGRSMQHWFAEMLQEGDATVAAATVACAIRSASWGRAIAQAPSVAAWSELEVLKTDPRFAWTNRYEFRFASGEPMLDGVEHPPERHDAALSQVWINDAPARGFDFLSLAALCDAFFGRVFHVRGRVFPIATVSMTIQFHITTDDLGELAAAPLLGVADASLFDRGFFDQAARVWSPGGRLVASTVQMVKY